VALPDDEAFSQAVKASPDVIAQLNKATPTLKPYSRKALAIDAPDRVMPVFRALNSAQFGRLDAQAQWLSLQQSSPLGALGRQRVAAWEAQNLRMATTVREVTAAIPGGRTLLIVGASHKTVHRGVPPNDDRYRGSVRSRVAGSQAEWVLTSIST
jgi:hypothetical protein